MALRYTGRYMRNGGFTVIEILLAMFLLATGVVAIAGVSLLATRTTLRVEKNVVAQAIANDAIEKIQAMPYGMVGELPEGATLVSGGITEESIRYTQDIAQNGQQYTLTIDVVAADDEANGQITGALTLANADYKRLRVQVEPKQGEFLSSTVSASATISNWPPDTCVPGMADACPAPTVPERPATYTFDNYFKIRDFVNSTGLYTSIPLTQALNGALYPDMVTARKVCEIKGYASVVGVPGYGENDSPEDNPLAQWVPAQNDFVIRESCDKDDDIPNIPNCYEGDAYLNTLTCGDPQPIEQCTAMLPCPSSGVCTDAYRERGYTPTGVQYPAACKSNLDCNMGYSCNTESGQCEAIPGGGVCPA